MRKYIFVLTCPRTKKIRVVGHTTNPLRRYLYYIYDSRPNPIGDWIKSYRGRRPDIKVIEIVTSKKQIRERMSYWTEYYRKNNLLGLGKINKTVMIRFLVTHSDSLLIQAEADKYCEGNLPRYLRMKVMQKKEAY